VGKIAQHIIGKLARTIPVSITNNKHLLKTSRLTAVYRVQSPEDSVKGPIIPPITLLIDAAKGSTDAPATLFKETHMEAFIYSSLLSIASVNISCAISPLTFE
jgi:hypothetical protein